MSENPLKQAARTFGVNSAEFWAAAARLAGSAPGVTITFDSPEDAGEAFLILNRLGERGWQPGDPAYLKMLLSKATIRREP